MRILRFLACAALVVTALAGGAFVLARRPGRVAYVGATVLTMDARDRTVSAVGTDGDRIAVAGSDDEVRQWAATSGARVVELPGRAVIPGFIDAHGHFPGEGLFAVRADLRSPPVGEVRDLDDVVARLREQAERAATGEWVVGIGFDDTLVAEQRHLSRADLDRVSTSQPVLAMHVSGHLASVNGAALEVLGYHRDTADPSGGRIRRDPASGEPDGVLEESALDPLKPLVLNPGLRETVAIARAASALYVARGVTTAQDGHATLAHMRGLAWLSRLGVIPLRLVLWPEESAAEALLRGDASFGSWDDRWVRLGAAKLVADGSIQGYTAYLTQPYTVPPGDDPSFRGYPRISKDVLRDTILRLHAAGWQVAVHGNGDASIDDILDGFEAAQRAVPRADARHVIVHAQTARDDQLDRMAALGIVPSFFVLHTYYWGDRHRERFLGPERAARISPTASAAARGIRFTLHADSPVVPMEPLRIVWSAVNRRTTSGEVLGQGERIGVRQALRAVTIDAAWQHFQEDDRGSIAPGKLADLVVLDRSPETDPTTIDRIRVLATVIGGREVYTAAQ